MTTRGKLSAFTLGLLTLVLASLLPWANISATATASGGLANPGFEDGILGSLPDAWVTVLPVPDAVVVVGAAENTDVPLYAELGITDVVPHRGDLMLRLGTPKPLSSNQDRGENTVVSESPFTATQGTLKFSFRLFSWEHRGNDVFRFDLTNADGSVGTLASPLSITTSDGTPIGTCSGALPCEINGIDVGKRGQFLDSGWLEAEIIVDPTDGPFTLTYAVGGTKNNAHATWAYFDDVNTPPVANFTFTPLVDEGGDLTKDCTPYLSAEGIPATDCVPVTAGDRLEGSLVQLVDLSYDLDPGDTIDSWDWTVEGPNEGDAACSVQYTSDAQRPNFIPIEQGDYHIKLVVTDKNGDSAVAESGGFKCVLLSDDTYIPEITDHGTSPATLEVGNAPPLVNALNVEVLEGEAASLFGRFLDTGWLDTHEAEWELGGLTDGGEPPIILVEPWSQQGLVQETDGEGHILGNGVVSGSVSATHLAGLDPSDPEKNSLLGVLRVTDDDGGYQDDPFVLQAVADDPARHEPNDILADAGVLPSSASYLSYIQSEGDIDIFEVMWPGTPSTCVGEEGVILPMPCPQPLPAGTEVLVALGDLPADYDLVLLTERPSAETAPFQMSPFQMSPFQMSPFQMSPFQMSPFQMSPFQMSQLSQMSFTGLDGTQISGIDIETAELSLGDIVGDDVQVASFSANRGLEDETALARIDLPGTRVFVAIIGSNGAYSDKPYRLQIETSMPLDTAILEAGLDTGLCEGTPVVDPPVTPTDDALFVELYAASTAPSTLIVTQQQRLEALYQLPVDFWSQMSALADATNGRVISIRSDIYDPWDNNPCSIDAVNSVAGQVRAAIQGHENIQYVVIAGGDGIVPFRRAPDETVISNERYYLMGSFLKPGSPLFSSLQQGYNLTDDFYVDEEPTPWQGRALYIPDLPIGRLVETPDEIVATIQTYVDSVTGSLDATTAFVSGYDFFIDGAQAMADLLGADYSMISDSWSAQDLETEFLCVDSSDPDCAASNVNAVNAHFTHYAALSANGFNTGTNDILNTESVALAGDYQDLLKDTIVFSMGCHAGLNVSDDDSLSADSGLGIDPALDFAQAMAQQRAIYIASTGYGLGDDAGLGGTELLMVKLAEEIASGETTIGEMLVAAKRHYLSSLSAMTTYDEKSSIQTTLYGLPMWNVGTSPLTAAASLLAETTGTGIDPESITPPFVPVITDGGTYYTVDGDAQTTAGRPIQPRIVMEIDPNASAGPVHGVLLTSGAFTDVTGSDPVISRPTIEWEEDPVEPQTCLPSYWPSELITVNSLAEDDQTLVIIPGQFRCDSGANSPVTGTQRLYSSLGFELLRSTSGDWQPPVVSSVDLHALGNGTVDITVSANDYGSGIKQIVVLKIGNNTISTLESLLLTEPFPESGEFTINIPDPEGAALVIQVVDGADNVTYATGKGANLSLIDIDTAATRTVDENTQIELVASVTNSDESLNPPFSYIWEFGDDSFAGGQAVYNDELNIWEIKVVHTYPDDNPTGTPSDDYTTTLKVTDAAGGIGNATVVVEVLNVAPAVFAPQDMTSLLEGSTVSPGLVGFYDVGIEDSHPTATVNWGDGTSIEVLDPGPTLWPCDAEGIPGLPPPGDLAATCGTVSLGSHVYADDDAYTVTVTVTDDDGGVGSDTFSVIVDNVAPTVDAGEDQIASGDGTVSLDPATFNDLGTLDTHTATIDWGDGTATEAGAVSESPFGPPGDVPGANGTVSGSHTYTGSGTYTVTVTVTDDDLGSASDTFTVSLCLDPKDVVFNPDSPDWPYQDLADLRWCAVDNIGTQMSITLHMEAPVVDPIDTGDLRYRVILDLGAKDLTTDKYDGQPDGIGDLVLSYKDGKAQGMDSLTVGPTDGGGLAFVFNLAEVGGGDGGSINIRVEVQMGVKKTGASGIPDQMPDAGYFEYMLK